MSGESRRSTKSMKRLYALIMNSGGIVFGIGAGYISPPTQPKAHPMPIVSRKHNPAEVHECGRRKGGIANQAQRILSFSVGKPDDPDFRRWGGPGFWFQNQRLIYWPMVAAGDFDLMRPWFEMYWQALPLAARADPEVFWTQRCALSGDDYILGSRGQRT